MFLRGKLKLKKTTQKLRSSGCSYVVAPSNIFTFWLIICYDSFFGYPDGFMLTESKSFKISEISEICFSFNDDERQYNRIKYSPSN